MNLQAAEAFIVAELRRGLSPTPYDHGHEAQASFLSRYHYRTATAVARRAAPKQAQPARILALAAAWPSAGETA